MKNIKTIGHSSDDGQEIMSQFENNGADHFEKKPTYKNIEFIRIIH